MKTARWMLGLLTAGAIAAGCGPGFDPYNRLNSLRVLAIRSEPVAPMSGETTTIDAELYRVPETDPLNPTPTTFAWSWCPVPTSGNPDCPFPHDDLAALIGAPVSPYELGDTETVTFENSIPPAALAAACQGIPGSPKPNCTDGFPIEVRLIVTKGIEQVIAVRPLRLRFRAEDQANTNPKLNGGLFAVIEGTRVTIDPAINPAVTAVLPRHKETVVGTPLDENQSELYNGEDDDGNAAAVRERLNVSWFVETGDTNHERTTFIVGKIPIEDVGQIKWTPAFSTKYMSETARLFVILRDDRDGVDWIEGTVRLEPKP